MDDMQKVEEYINKEIKPYLPMIIGKIRIKDLAPKPLERADFFKIRIWKYLKLPVYQSINKNQSFFYKPIYRFER